MTGGFALGEDDPLAGARVGARAGSILTLRARVIIADVARFAHDSEHAATLEGAVSFAPIGDDLPIRAGHVALFIRSADPNLKLMVYRATFEHAGRVYCLDGAKQVRRGSVFHAWRATTTLPCRLHEGADPTAPVAGAGILRLTPVSFLKQLASFGTLNARTLGGKARTMAAFLRFFSGELIDTYVWSASPR